MSNDSSKGFRRSKKRFRILGLDLDQWLRFFFGGNASFAIIALLLICVFLFKEAVTFFPIHSDGLKLYRLSGQEFVDHIEKEVTAHRKLGGSLAKAFYGEVNASSEREQNLLVAYEGVLENVRQKSAKETRRLVLAMEKAIDCQDSIDELESEPDPEADPDIATLKGLLPALMERVKSRQTDWRNRVSALLEEKSVWSLQESIDLNAEDREKLAGAVLEAEPEAEDDPAYVIELNGIIDSKKEAAEEKYGVLNEVYTAFRNAGRPLNELVGELRETARETKDRAVNAKTLAKGKEALFEGAKKAGDEATKADFLSKAEAIQVEKIPFDEINKLYYGKIDEHRTVTTALATELQAIANRVPTDADTAQGRENLKAFHRDYPAFLDQLEDTDKELRSWDHKAPYSFFRSIVVFFTGKDWITNSSWHDFYGILPLFTGSLLISVIALLVSVPVSVSAAIYVNQLAGPREQNLIKPTIEFIQAIPSIVLGFFGIAVLGTALRELSQVEWLAWVPGFPMQERLNVLNAGLLLAFMAIPTIFTLTEDALNNVPRSFSEGSLALGATRLQTISRIVVPGALSGIIAAVLLGFGRIIGETMVVLLVAGGSISIPDFSAGLGVVTQPVHTMTGIIAQETGEVDQGSIHYRALFMVGMVLFTISLSINYLAQKVLKRYQMTGG
ncbi:MAG: phosphate ABC transporter permease subunit PstC [Verrucomicrobiota bacterium]